MEFRLHLTPADLGKIRLLPRPSPVIETSLSALLLRQATLDPFVLEWRRRAAQALGPAAASMLEVMGSNPIQISDLVYRHALAAASYEEAIDAFLATPRTIISRDLTHVPGDSGGAIVDRALRAGDHRAMREVAANLRRYHAAVVDPQWHVALNQGHAAFTALGRRFAENGVNWLLGNLNRRLRWEPPVLTLQVECPIDQRLGVCRYHDLHDFHSDFFLDGRGLVLVPSMFLPSAGCWLWCDDVDDRPAVLIYPAAQDRRALQSPQGKRPGQLGTLLGTTRAAVMEALGGAPRSTTELAYAVGISLASASQHAAVLRGAGLAESLRQGGSVIHSLTASGVALLEETA